MVHLTPMEPLATSKMKADAQVSNTGVPLTQTTGDQMEPVLAPTHSRTALQLFLKGGFGHLG
jgi:hypothetical protein